MLSFHLNGKFFQAFSTAFYAEPIEFTFFESGVCQIVVVGLMLVTKIGWQKTRSKNYKKMS